MEARLGRAPGVVQVARFGSSLHVSGTDAAVLLASMEALADEGTHRVSVQPGGIEEAFIYLMAGARDNFARDAA
jgi:ABC-2 type transport system ATP-binding protein